MNLLKQCFLVLELKEFQGNIPLIWQVTCVSRKGGMIADLQIRAVACVEKRNYQASGRNGLWLEKLAPQDPAHLEKWKCSLETCLRLGTRMWTYDDRMA